MRDNQQAQQTHEGTSKVALSFQETSQALVDGILTLQEYQLKMAHSLLSTWFGSCFGRRMEPHPIQKQSTENLPHQWGLQLQKQQAAFQRLAAASMRLSTGTLLAPLAFWTPFSFSRQAIDAATTELEHQREWASKSFASALQYAYGQEPLSEETLS